MTPLETLKALMAKATPAPWEAWQPATTGLQCREWTVSRLDLAYSHKDMQAIVCTLNSDGSNAQFIAYMRNALPDLLAALEAFADVAEQANGQWSDDYLWEKWGLDKQMDKGRAALSRLTTPQKDA